MEDYFTHRNSTHRFQIQKIDDKGDIQLIDADGLTDEQFTKIMRVFPHGFTSHSVKGSHMVGLSMGGRRDQLLALGGEHHEKRIKDLKEGESVLYDSEGNVVFMHLGKGISITTKKGPVDVQAKSDFTSKAEGKQTHVSKGTAAFGSSGGITFIGGNGQDGTYAFVATEAGLSTTVKAKL